MEEPRFQQLCQICDDPQIHECTNVIGGGLTKLFSVDPLRYVYTARCVLRIVAWNYDHWENPHFLLDSDPVVTFQVVIQFLIESVSKLIKQCDWIQSFYQLGKIPSDESEFVSQIQIQGTSESVDSWGRNICVKKYTEFQYVEHENRAQDMEISASQTEYDVKYPFLCVNFHTI